MVRPPERLNGEPGTPTPLIVTETRDVSVPLITNASAAEVPTMNNWFPTNPAWFTVTVKLPEVLFPAKSVAV